LKYLYIDYRLKVFKYKCLIKEHDF
jgi:hypothetical protein